MSRYDDDDKKPIVLTTNQNYLRMIELRQRGTIASLNHIPKPGFYNDVTQERADGMMNYLSMAHADVLSKFSAEEKTSYEEYNKGPSVEQLAADAAERNKRMAANVDKPSI